VHVKPFSSKNKKKQNKVCREKDPGREHTVYTFTERTRTHDDRAKAQSYAKKHLDWPTATPGSRHRQNSKATIVLKSPWEDAPSSILENTVTRELTVFNTSATT